MTHPLPHDKLLRRFRILMALTTFAMLATVVLMAIRFSLLQAVLLVVQAGLVAGQVVCFKKICKLREQAA